MKKVLKDNSKSITKGSVRRMARRAGIKRISGLLTEEVRGSVLDISERKRIDAALRESEAKFAAVFRVCPESISISQLDDGVYVDVNDAYEDVFGYRRDRVLGRSALDLGIWVDALERRDLVRRLEQDRIVRDFDASILDLVAETDLFDIKACAAVDHDPATHQLRQIAPLAFEAARRGDRLGHYELLLRSRS